MLDHLPLDLSESWRGFLGYRSGSSWSSDRGVVRVRLAGV